MITPEGYSKDPTLPPDGICVTFGKEMIAEKGGLLRFIRWFEHCMKDEDDIWYHKCKGRPSNEDLLYVYVIICNRVYYRCLYGGYEKGKTEGYLHGDGDIEVITWPRIILAGPFEKAPIRMIRKGFQGFRYCTKLF